MLAALTLALLSVRLWIAMRRIDRRWIARELNRLCPELQDSTELLDVDGTALSPVTRLQQARARSILETLSLPELRRPWPQRQLGLAWVLGSVMLIAAGCWPPAIPPAPSPNAASRLAVGTAAAATPAVIETRGLSLTFATAAERPVQETLQAAAAAGYDLSPALPLIESLRRRP